MFKSTRFSWYLTYSWGLFLLIFIYLLCRALWVAPLHDESATYLHFIELEKLFGEGVIQDANNHLLNSFLGIVVHHFFGENFFLIRLPNVLCFAVYFSGAYTLIKSIDSTYFKIILLTAMVTVPYMNDYFAYTRGYGMAISFFTWMLVYAHKWLLEPTSKNAGLLYFFSLMAIFANLVFLVSGCLAMALVGLIHLSKIRQWHAKKQLLLFTLHFLFLLGLYPFVKFSYMLKEGGALYYGSLDGFWEVTGKTLMRYVLFYDADWQRWLWMCLIALFAFLLLYLFITKGFWGFFKEKLTVFGWFFFGNLAAIFILAKFFQVNYPEDRAGMYFIPLSILIFGFSIWRSRVARPLVFLLLFFPVTFIAHINLNTSVFTPDERISLPLYQAVKKELNSETTMSIYHTMLLNWSMYERTSKDIKFQPSTNNAFSSYYDIVINKSVFLDTADLRDYQLIYYDKPSGNMAYKRKKPLERSLFRSHEIPALHSSDEYVNILNLALSDSMQRDNLILKIKGNLDIENKYRDVKFVISTFDSKENPIRYEYFDQRWIHGADQLKFPVNINHFLGKFSSDETELRLYIWNPQHSTINFRNGEIHFYKIKE